MAVATSARSPRAPFRAATQSRRAAARRVAPPLEHRILMTATLCLLAFGAVMVYCASSPASALASNGNGAGTFIRYVVFGAIGLTAMYVLERRGIQTFDSRLTRTLLIASFVLLLLVLVPGIGVEHGGSRRWLGSGAVSLQPSEVMKFALILHVARWLSENPNWLRHGFKKALSPIAIIVIPACALIAKEPDLGTALTIALTLLTLLIAGGLPRAWVLRVIGGAAMLILLVICFSAYQRARLTAFLHPATPSSIANSEFQGYQGQVTLGSGGLFGVGLGKSVQNILTLPEAQSDFILAVVGEQLGVAGIFCLVFLYGMIAYAGLRTARRAGTRYAKLLATGLTSLILCQALLNIFVVLGLAPLTGVPLPFISYAPSNLCVLLASVGMLLNISRPAARRLKAVDPERHEAQAAREVLARDRRRQQRAQRPYRSAG